MKITRIEVRPLNLALQTALTVAYGSYSVLEYAMLIVETDNGLVGLGEASPDPEVTGETQDAVIAALQSTAEFLEGRDPFDMEALLGECLRRFPQAPAAVAAVDMALYDLAGKKLGVPLYQLLGGRARPAVNLYPVIPMSDPKAMAQMSAMFTGMGATVLKLKLGSDPEEDLARLEAVHQAVGQEVRLRLDINQGWKDAPTAVGAIRAAAKYTIEWIEQPVADKDLDGMAAVRSAVSISIMADESVHNAADVFRIAEKGAADLVNIKLMKCGGVRQAGKMLAAAEAAGLPCILGSMGESSIGSAAGLHFITANPGILACELLGPLFLKNDPAYGYPVDRETMLVEAGEAPGLGVTLR